MNLTQPITYVLRKSNNTGRFHYLPSSSTDGATFTGSKSKKNILKAFAKSVSNWKPSDEMELPADAPTGVALPTTFDHYESTDALLADNKGEVPPVIEYRGEYNDDGTPNYYVPGQ